MLNLPTLLLAGIAQCEDVEARAPPLSIATPSHPSGSLVFYTLAQDAPVGSRPDAPAVYVAKIADDLAAFIRFLNTQHQRRVTQVEFASSVVLAVFAGAKSTSGHQITAQQVIVENQQLRIVVLQQTPDSHGYALPAFTSPYHVVQVSRAAFGPSLPGSWVLLDAQGPILATGGHQR